VKNLLLASSTLWRREIVRFYRQPNRVVGAAGTPLLFWFLLGSGVGRSFQGEGTHQNYSLYVLPGMIVLVLLFTAIFSTISIIEDRKEGFLQSVLVAPVPRPVVVFGKVLGGASLAILQALVLIALAPLAGAHLDPLVLPQLLGILIVLGLGLTSLGFFIAWRMQSIQGFHAIMNLFLLPLWVLSGALFPAQGASSWLRFLIAINPLSYGLAAVRRLLLADPGPGVPSLAAGWVVSLVFAFVAFGAASVVARGHTRGDLL
jgi:ABC-2 type transport system permease protein